MGAYGGARNTYSAKPDHLPYGPLLWRFLARKRISIMIRVCMVAPVNSLENPETQSSAPADDPADTKSYPTDPFPPHGSVGWPIRNIS